MALRLRTRDGGAFVTTPGKTRVAVVGAGVAGLVIATMLRRRGIRCDVFEQSAAFDPVGAGIQLSPNGVRILQGLGAAAALAERGVPAGAIETRRWDNGALLSRVPHGARCELAYGAPYYLIHRADLQNCLLSLLPPGGIELGRRVTRVTEHPGHVELSFADGGSAMADVVIGADGVHSAVRGTVIRDRPRFSGYVVYRGLVPAGTVPSFETDPRVLFWLGPQRHLTYYPVSAGRAVHFSAVRAMPGMTGPPTAEAGVDELLESFDGWHEQVRRLLTAAESVTRWGLFDRDLAERYCGDRLALVGDAAHPMLPYLSQGANQALEDAVVLADCLTDDATDVPAALRRYESLRLPRTAEVHRRSRLRATTYHLADGEAQRQRDRGLAGQGSLEHLDWLYGHEYIPAAAYSGG
jgi:salicylate hydroxylase